MAPWVIKMSSQETQLQVRRRRSMQRGRNGPMVRVRVPIMHLISRELLVRYASIPDEEFLKTPHPNHDASKLLPEYGGGYIAYLEVSHQMHVSYWSSIPVEFS